MKILECNNLSYGYDGKPIGNHISLSIEKASYVCIIGENGIGKTSLLKTLTGLIKPIKGKVFFMNQEEDSRIGYVAQNTQTETDFPATVNEIVQSGGLKQCGWKPFYSKEVKLNASRNMKAMDIWRIRNQSYKNLSGGQQQRVLLARALTATPDVIFLDEPTSGLDPSAKKDLYACIQKLNGEGLTVIMISHDLDHALNCASHILHLNKDDYFYGSRREYHEVYMERGGIK